MPSIFFSRAMDGLSESAIVRAEESFREAVAPLGMEIVNPFQPDRHRYSTSRIERTVQADLLELAKADVLVGDLSLPDRSYVGAIFEIAEAYRLGIPILVWVGGTRLGERIWLRYYAEAICREQADAVRVLYRAFTPTGRRENRRLIQEYYSSVAEHYATRDGYIQLSAVPEDAKNAVKQEMAELAEWVAKLPIIGRVLDLGAGSGKWLPIWRRAATQVLCLDFSLGMLSALRAQQPGPNISCIVGDFSNTEWLETTMRRFGTPEVVILAFALNSLSRSDQVLLVDTLRKVSAVGTILVALENQQTLFGYRDLFSRTVLEVREPQSVEPRELLKCNFLPGDLVKLLDRFGSVVDQHSTSDYFTAGVALRDPDL